MLERFINLDRRGIFGRIETASACGEVFGDRNGDGFFGEPLDRALDEELFVGGEEVDGLVGFGFVGPDVAEGGGVDAALAVGDGPFEGPVVFEAWGSWP